MWQIHFKSLEMLRPSIFALANKLIGKPLTTTGPSRVVSLVLKFIRSSLDFVSLRWNLSSDARLLGCQQRWNRKKKWRGRKVARGGLRSFYLSPDGFERVRIKSWQDRNYADSLYVSSLRVFYHLKGERLPITSSAWSLGVLFNVHMVFIDHISNICKNTFFLLRNLSKIRKYLTRIRLRWLSMRL